MWRTESSIDVTRNGYLLDETDLVLHGLANDHEQLVVRLLHHVCLVTHNWLFSNLKAELFNSKFLYCG